MEGAHYAQRRVHPDPPDRDPRRRQAAADERVRARRGRPRLGAAEARATPRAAKQIPEAERWYFLEEKYPKYGNLVPRDIASREIYDVCVNKGLGVDGKMCVYLDLTHIPRETLMRKLEGILEIYEKFTGEDPCDVPMKIFPAVHYSMGGLWVDYERTADGFLDLGSPKNQMTNMPGPVRHRRVRLPVPRRQPPRRQLAAVLRLRRPGRRPRGGRRAREAGQGGHRGAVVGVRRRAEKKWADALRRARATRRPREPVPAARGTRADHARERHDRARQRQAARDRRQDPRADGALAQARACSTTASGPTRRSRS